MSDAHRKMLTLWVINTRTRSLGDMMAQEDTAVHLQTMEWFAAEASDGVRRIFGPYLSFANWRA